MKANKIINGTHGKVFLNGDKLANVKSFEAKLTLDFEEVDLSEQLGKQQKYIGYSGAGTMVLHKVDSYILKTYAEGIKKGVLPEIMIIAGVDDPASIGAERVQLNDITFDEVTLMKFEQKKLGEEEVPFKFGDFTPLDMIEKE